MFANDIKIAAIVTTLVILLLIAFVVIIIFIANKRHVQQEVRLAQMELDYEKELRTVEQEVQEQVLSNVSRELHDNIGQLLTLMRIQIEQEKVGDNNHAALFEPIDGTLNTTISQVRALSKSLNNEMLEHNGLLNTLQNEITRLNQLGRFSIEWQLEEKEPELTKDQRLMSFRIFQELINNILKHSGASNVLVVLKSNERFYLSIKDDGIGFDVEAAVNSGGGSGLKNMLKRANLAGFQFNIDSIKGKGSTFTLEQGG